MSRRGTRRRRSAPSPYGGPVRRLLALPAVLQIRWLCIVAVMAVATAAYAAVLLTAPPMPPSRAPVARIAP
ncbi:hypothetical protein [Kitasatospora mediocidica]|uniref:hypothetical protein n=1 Tax=Kitasatospora mediocidica TaxID=58352 RepID=UPI0012FC894B|nr:hypothetical protein [Kitasatospora mediocidica]